MKEHFLTYEQSIAVKELGFDEKCSGYYHICNTEELKDVYECDYFFQQEHNTFNSGCLVIKAPLKSQFFKWAREKYGIKRQQVSYDDDYDNYWYEKWFNTYEEAEDACINGIIELIKKIK